ncbi:MAG: hypothetical protein GXP62_11145 [Oligoflexia bacterium]|nr:hypothetical protein [Oligoflexia bacterium]
MRSPGYTGTLQRVDLGTGTWVLVDDAGTRWQLNGKIPQELVGQRVTVHASPSSAQSFGMAGPTLRVHRIQAIKGC